MNNRIREYRARLDFTQDDLAKKVNVRRETIVFPGEEQVQSSLKLAHDIAVVFGVPIEEIFIFGED
jgi:putative transcriptional regulator